MKKLFFSVLVFSVFAAVNAQDFKKVTTPYILKKLEEAKTEIDKITADAKAQSNPATWFWKASVYGAIFDDDGLNQKYPFAASVAASSFAKYMELDPSMKVMNEDQFAGKAIIDFLYRGNLRKGISYFDKKQWDSAYKYFSESAAIGDIITKNNWKNNKQPIDTTTVLFSGYAAQNAKRTEDAVKYYSRIADLKITNVAAAGNIKDVYEYLASHYLQTKNTEKFNKYLGYAKELFPASSDLWADYESEYVEKNMSLAEKAAAYDKADAAGTLTANQYLAYGNMFYNIKEDERSKMDSATLANYRTKAEQAFIKGFNKDNLNGLLAFNAGLLNYNDWATTDDLVQENRRKMRELNQNKSTDKDPKKRAAADAKIKEQVSAIQKKNVELEKLQNGYADKGIEWVEKAYTVLSKKENLDRVEKSTLGKTVDYLANLYQWKRDKSKGNAAEYDKYDALYKKYDALHGKV
jgi:hypothetical protein